MQISYIFPGYARSKSKLTSHRSVFPDCNGRRKSRKLAQIITYLLVWCKKQNKFSNGKLQCELQQVESKVSLRPIYMISATCEVFVNDIRVPTRWFSLPRSDHCNLFMPVESTGNFPGFRKIKHLKEYVTTEWGSRASDAAFTLRFAGWPSREDCQVISMNISARVRNWEKIYIRSLSSVRLRFVITYSLRSVFRLTIILDDITSVISRKNGWSIL